MAVNGFQYCISPVSKPGESKTTGLSCGGNQGNYKVFSDYGLCLFWPFCCCFLATDIFWFCNRFMARVLLASSRVKRKGTLQFLVIFPNQRQQ